MQLSRTKAIFPPVPLTFGPGKRFRDPRHCWEHELSASGSSCRKGSPCGSLCKITVALCHRDTHMLFFIPSVNKCKKSSGEFLERLHSRTPTARVSSTGKEEHLIKPLDSHRNRCSLTGSSVDVEASLWWEPHAGCRLPCVYLPRTRCARNTARASLADGFGGWARLCPPAWRTSASGR